MQGYENGRQEGAYDATVMDNAGIAKRLEENALLQRKLLEGEGFDAKAADEAVWRAGYAAGLATKISREFPS